MAASDNVFLITGIPFDPPITSAQQIEERLAELKKEWVQDSRSADPVVRNTALRHIGHIDEYKAELLDSGKRGKAAAEAKKLRQNALGEIGQSFESRGGKDYIVRSEYNLIVGEAKKKYKGYQITDADIQKLCKKNLVDKAPEASEQNDLPTITYRESDAMGKLLKSLLGGEINEKTLYDFLGKSPKDSLENLRAAAQAIADQVLSKAAPTAEDSSRKALAGNCLTMFKSPENKAKYDNFLTLVEYPRTYDHAVTTIRSIKPDKTRGPKPVKIVNKQTLNAEIDFAIRTDGLSMTQADAYIRRISRFLDAVVEDDSKIKCASCGTENSASAITCSNCQKQMFIICPRCNTKNENNAVTCVGCKLDFSQMEKALPYITKAKEAILAKNVDQAEAALLQADSFWPNHPETTQLREMIAQQKQELEKRRSQADEIIKTIHNNVAAGQFYTANIGINSAQQNKITIDAQTVKLVRDTVAQIDADIAKIKSGAVSGDVAFELLYAANEKVKDKPEIGQMLLNYPPQAPASLQAKAVHRAAELRFPASASGARVSYEIIRKRASRPNSREDGKKVYEGVGTSFSDNDLSFGVEYYYAVFAVRAGVASQTFAVSEPVVLIKNLENLKAVSGDGTINLSWDAPETVVEVRVSRGLVQGGRPAYAPLPNKRVDGFMDSGLKNGVSCHYKLTAVHQIAGRRFESEELAIEATPEKPIKPVEGLKVAMEDNVFSATWSPCEWDVLLLCAPEKPTITPGQIYNVNELMKSYQKIDIKSQSRQSAEFTMRLSGGMYIFPVAMRGTNAIPSEPVLVTNIPNVKNASAQTTKGDTYIFMDWPVGVKEVLILCRNDQFPQSPADGVGTRQSVTKVQYEHEGGALLKNVGTQKLYAKIYTVFMADGEPAYSDGVEIEIENAVTQEVRYSLKYSKSLFGKHKISVTFKASGVLALPDIVFMGKENSLPLNKNDGDVVGTLSSGTEIKNVTTIDIPVHGSLKGQFVKAFLADERMYSKYLLRPESMGRL